MTIVISLLYVAYEFRRTETLSSNEVDTIFFERVRDANATLIENADIAEIVIKAISSPDTLSAADRLRYLAFRHKFFDSWEVTWIYHEDGILDDATWAEWDQWLAEEARRRPDFGWAENRQHFTGAGFRLNVDERVELG